MLRKLLVLIVFQLALIQSYAQEKPRFWDDVQTIKAYDRMFAPPTNPVLFIGSSSIRKWDDLERVFAAYNALNRGIGGSVISDMTFYLNDIVFAYNPKQIIIYVGENDRPDEQTTADSVLNRFKVLYNGIRAKLPTVPIAYIAIKPSPSRDKFRQKAIDANKLISDFIAHEQHIKFIDIFTPMLKNGQSRPELFVSDLLHMNQDGYAIWQKKVKPYLIK